jgi:hypothetical protein
MMHFPFFFFFSKESFCSFFLLSTLNVNYFFTILLQDRTNIVNTYTFKRSIDKMAVKPETNPRKPIGNYWLGKTLGHGSSGVSAMACKAQYIHTYYAFATNLVMAKSRIESRESTLMIFRFHLLKT